MHFREWKLLYFDSNLRHLNRDKKVTILHTVFLNVFFLKKMY